MFSAQKVVLLPLTGAGFGARSNQSDERGPAEDDPLGPGGARSLLTIRKRPAWLEREKADGDNPAYRWRAEPAVAR